MKVAMLSSIAGIEVVERKWMPRGMALLVADNRIVAPAGLTLEEILRLEVLNRRAAVVLDAERPW